MINFNIEDENGTYTINEKNICFVYVSKGGRERSYMVTNSGQQIELTDFAAKTIADAIKGEQ